MAVNMVGFVHTERLAIDVTIRKSTLNAIRQRMIQHNAKSDALADNMKKYKRDAIISIAGFAAMKLLEKFAPTAFAGLKILRTGLVLGIARDFIKSGVECLFKDKRPNADTLTATAVIASVLAGKPESSLTLLALSNGAELLTTYAAEKARTHISGLLSLDQRYVWKVDGEVETKIPVEEVKAGDIVASHTGEKIVVDGVVIEGTAAVNQASITGESRPAMKSEGAQVYAGSVVEAGELLIKVEKVGKDTSLANIVHLVEEAQTRKAPIQNFADQMANYLVPVSFIGAAIVYGATRDWQRVLNLLFIDFSCGLKLSTATAMSAAIGAAAKRGILVKGGNYIETLANTRTVVFDKTGTLTKGKFEITKIYPENSDILKFASIAESASSHPIAKAIKDAYKNDLTGIIDIKEFAGKGIEVLFNNEKIRVGKHNFIGSEPVNEQGIIVYVSVNDTCIGYIVLSDILKEDSALAIKNLNRMNINTIMLTGDSNKNSDIVKELLGIKTAYSELLPADKVNKVEELISENAGIIAFVGDGINDAPVLKRADIGIAMGGIGSDITIEASDVVIMDDKPSKIITAINISKKTLSIAKQNIFFAIAVKLLFLILGSLGLMSIWGAVFADVGVTLLTILNSLRLKTYKE